MSTPLEKHLEFHCEQLEKKIDEIERDYEQRLEQIRETLASYREVVSHQQDQICGLKEKLHAISINRVYSA